MTKQPAYFYRMLVLSLMFTVSSVLEADDRLTAPQVGNAFTHALLPGFARPSLQNWASGLAGSSSRIDPRFLLKPVDEHAGGIGVTAEPVVVDNLLRYRF
jgi:hypothetical protein